MSKWVNSCLPMSIHVYWCQFMFTNVNSCWAMSIHVYLCQFIFTYVSSCLPMSIHVYQCLFVFTNSNSCLPMTIHVYQFQFIFTKVYLCSLIAILKFLARKRSYIWVGHQRLSVPVIDELWEYSCGDGNQAAYQPD